MKSFLGSAISKYDVDDYEDDEVTKAKAKTVYKPWDQIVTDEQNRRRFHGAFTGGFSAGFFNTVGSREGWKPSEFKSSAGNRADKRKQRVEDYMDEEDLKEFRAAAASGGTKRPGPLSQAAAEGFKKRREKEREATSASSSSSSSTAAAARGKEEERAAEGRDGEGEAPVAPSADLAEGLGVLKGVMEASSSVGSKILRQMGWRPGTRVCMPRARRVPRELRVALDEIRRREKEERRETMKKEETKREEGGGGSPKESRPVVKGPTMPSQAALERMRLEREVEQVEMGGGEEEEEETEEARRYRRLKERAEAMERDLERQFGLSQHRPPALSAGDPLPRPLDDDRRGLGFSAPSLRQMVDVPGSSTAVSGQRGGRAGGGMSGGRFPFLQQRGILWEEDDNESSLMMGSSAGLFGKGRGGRGKPSRDVEEDEMESSGYFSFLPAEGEEEPLSSFGQAGSSRDIMGIGAGEGPLPLPAGGRPLALTERGESANVQKLQKSKRDGVPFPPMYTSASDDTQGRVESSDVVLDVEGGGGRSRGLLRLEERLGQKSEDARAPSWFDGKHKWPESDRLASSSQREERETQTAQHLLRAQQVDRGRERSRLTADDRREALGEAPRVPAPPRSSPSLSASAASNAKPEVPVKSEGGDGAAAAASSSSSSSSSVAAATASTAGVSAQERNQEMLGRLVGGSLRERASASVGGGEDL
uniref:G patch domain-containing protein n=1 Tax=Chromera velia CCMP2878 TaxID=1169474 RepID=A0A0K6S810_9ALVE|eukprot:Cvel_22372.t1-p1 / transcript=Cvel_22372.t1 / gene=Cvel_22372 / organism=Chromera_velia_CCMP2878 / gene_product=G patch domain-containing protein 1 homolog, putative / transcript_product=G patch domain-containing protein 1 homolog, putative / location=Cvel_scaffold2192:12531-16604(+) / protein_length=705 / sequence_SO=supercontig / SO=protein_coding / is_pseudo=false